MQAKANPNVKAEGNSNIKAEENPNIKAEGNLNVKAEREMGIYRLTWWWDINFAGAAEEARTPPQPHKPHGHNLLSVGTREKPKISKRQKEKNVP